MWRTSSKSDSAGQCVAVRQDLAALRDSKNPTGPVLPVNVRPLLAAVKTGRLR
jgi:hypothetical protein